MTASTTGGFGRAGRRNNGSRISAAIAKAISAMAIQTTGSLVQPASASAEGNAGAGGGAAATPGCGWAAGGGATTPGCGWAAGGGASG